MDIKKFMNPEEIKKGLEKFGLKLAEPEDVDKLQPLEKIDENTPTTNFDTQVHMMMKTQNI